MADSNRRAAVRGRHPGPVPDQPRRRCRLRLPRRGQHADPPGADQRQPTGSAPSCRGTSRAAGSWPRATPAPPARSASASPPAAPGRPTSSPASPTPRWTRSRSSPSPARSARRVIGTDAFQETPIVEVCRAITKHHYLVTRTEDIARVVKEAFHIATHRPARAGHHRRAQGRAEPKSIVPDWDPPMNLPGYRPDRRRHRRASCEAVARR